MDGGTEGEVEGAGLVWFTERDGGMAGCGEGCRDRVIGVKGDTRIEQCEEERSRWRGGGIGL